MEIVMNRILIVTGGFIDFSWAGPYIEALEYDGIIVADGGVHAARELGLRADVIIGDFDSAKKEELAAYETMLAAEGKKYEKITLPVNKDMSDTEAALVCALEGHASHITIIGANGTRFDHALANVHILARALQAGVLAYLVDAGNRIRLADRKNQVVIGKSGQYGRYVSLFPLTTDVRGVNAEGFLYPLKDAVLRAGVSLGVSNELAAEVGRITVQEGILIVIESRD